MTFIQITKLNNKLYFIKLSPFKILKVLRPVIYKHNLLEDMKITQVQHILVLEPAHPDTPVEENTPGINPNSQEKNWDIERILDSQPINNQIHYLIK